MTITADSRVLDASTILANARALEPLLREEAAECERGRRLTPRVVDALRTAGVFRMPMPASWGGPEIDILKQIEIIEVLSRADGSAGWCTMIGSDAGFYSAKLDDAVGRALYPDLDAITAGWIYPIGRLEICRGGYRLSGRWAFGSGCTHADVISAGAIVFDGDEPVLGSGGVPEWRVALLPAEEYEILDTWYTTGLAGSGSHDYRIERAFVPAEQTFALADANRPGTLYAWPLMFIANMTGVPLGIARDALDTAEAILAEKLMLPDRKPAKEQPHVRVAVGRAEAMVGSARSYAFDVLGQFWATLEAGDEPTLSQRAALGGSFVHTYQSCKAAVEILSEAVGTASIYRNCALERHRRDVTTVCMHIIGQNRMFESAGSMWLGDPPSVPFL